MVINTMAGKGAGSEKKKMIGDCPFKTLLLGIWEIGKGG